MRNLLTLGIMVAIITVGYLLTGIGLDEAFQRLTPETYAAAVAGMIAVVAMTFLASKIDH